jgi:hypothetical protein
VRTLGIDLASKPERTALAFIDWTEAGVVVNKPDSPVDDDMALRAIEDADWVGTDAPFGWPEAIVQRLPEFAARGCWQGIRDDHELRFRFTDRFVRCKTGLWPLSVSSDRIAVSAWRCARLLSRHFRGGIDRLGKQHHVLEVYPGAALTAWSFERHSYKRRELHNDERRAHRRGGFCYKSLKTAEPAGSTSRPYARRASLATTHLMP